MNTPKITLVTPSYNQGAYLSATIESVLAQDYPRLEYFVIDGGSSDSSTAILKRYDSALSGWVSEPDRGQAHAINKGFDRATGDIFGWLNSDDRLLPGALHTVARAFADPNVQVVTGLRQVINADGEWVSNWLRDRPTPAFLTRYCCVAQETTFWRRTVWEAAGPLDETYQFALDYEYWLRLLRMGYHFHPLPAYLGQFRITTTNKTTVQGDVFAAELARVFRQYDLAADEGDALMALGPQHSIRLAVLRQISTWPQLSPAWAVRLVRLLESRWALPLLEFLRGAYTSSEALAPLARRLPLAHALLSWSVRQAAPRRPPAALTPVHQLLTRWDIGLPTAALLDVTALRTLPTLPNQGIVLGTGWYPLEMVGLRTFIQWATPRAQLLVWSAASSPTLGIEVQGQFTLTVTDSGGKILHSTDVNGRQIVRVPLQQIAPDHLYLEAKPWSDVRQADDQRNLAFALLAVGWLCAPDGA